MKIYPAIDILNEKVVRLKKGDFNQVTVYSDDPFLMAQEWSDAGSKFIHVVDLDGAKSGNVQLQSIVEDIVNKTPLKVQFGGGVRSREVIDELMEIGVDRLVVGSLAVTNASLVVNAIKDFGDSRFTIALDVRFLDEEPFVLTNGWCETSSVSLWEAIEPYIDLPNLRFLCTDIDRDGMGFGSHIAFYKNLRKQFPDLKFQASGGISSLSEIQELRQNGLESGIVGRALYDGSLSFGDLKSQSEGVC